jgi:hypothetical protein
MATQTMTNRSGGTRDHSGVAQLRGWSFQKFIDLILKKKKKSKNFKKRVKPRL